MSAAQVFESTEVVDDTVLRLRETGAWLVALVEGRDTGEPVSEATRIDRIAALERLQASLEAAKSVEMVAFARSRAIRQVAQGIHPKKSERGIADEIALACRVSPTEGSRRLHASRDLVLDMPAMLEFSLAAKSTRAPPVESPSNCPISIGALAAKSMPPSRSSTWTASQRRRPVRLLNAPRTKPIRSDRRPEPPRRERTDGSPSGPRPTR